MIQVKDIKPVPLCRLREEHIPPVSLFCPGMELRCSNIVETGVIFVKSSCMKWISGYIGPP